MFKSNSNNQNKTTKNETTIDTVIRVNKEALSTSAHTNAEPEIEPMFTTSAFTVVFDGRQWQTVEIPIDPLTKKTGEWIVHPEDGTKMGAQERFKISVARKLFA